MKICFRKIAFFLAVIICLPMVFSACSQQGIDAEAVWNAIMQEVSFDDELKNAEASSQLYFSDLPEGAEVLLYLGSGYHADEVCRITLKQESDSEKAMQSVHQHLIELRSNFANYIPEEVDKINHAVIYQNGVYIFICVTNDYQNAAAVIEKAAKAPSTYLPGNDPSETADSNNPLPVPTSSDTDEPLTQTEDDPYAFLYIPGEDLELNGRGYPKLISKSDAIQNYGVVFRVDNAAYEDFHFGETTAANYAAVINRAAEALSGSTQVYSIAIPTSYGVTLPDNIVSGMANYSDQYAGLQKLFSNFADEVKVVDVYPALMAHRNEYIYFRTDHHWTALGAYYGYASFCKAKGISYIPLSEHRSVTFDNFLGTFYANHSGKDALLSATPDHVDAYYPISPNASMTFTDKNGNTYNWNIINDVSGYSSGTKYSTFAAADNPYSVLKNPDVSGGTCIVVKDSYANAMLPFLIDHYSTIYEIDFRYWNGDLVELANQVSADDLIFVNNLMTICTSTQVGRLDAIVK